MSDCSNLSVFNSVLGFALIAGTFISYYPQHHKIVKQRSHFGLSLMNFVCGNLVTWCSTLNYIAIEYHSTFDCCGSSFSRWECTNALLSFSQLLSILICSIFVLVLYVIHFDHKWAEQEERESGRALGSEWRRTKLILIVFLIVHLFFAGLLCVLIFTLGLDASVTHGYGVSLAIFASLLVSFHWLPQIYETYRLKTLGSLSFIMLALQSSGSVLTAFNLSSHGGWDVWLPYVVAAAMMYVLVFQGIAYWWRDRQHKKFLLKNSRFDDETTAEPGDHVIAESFVKHMDTESLLASNNIVNGTSDDDMTGVATMSDYQNSAKNPPYNKNPSAADERSPITDHSNYRSYDEFMKSKLGPNRTVSGIEDNSASGVAQH